MRKQSKYEYMFGKDDCIKVLSEKEITPGTGQAQELCNSEILIKSIYYEEFCDIEKFIFNEFIKLSFDVEDIESELKNAVLYCIENEFPDWIKPKIANIYKDIKEKNEVMLNDASIFLANIKSTCTK